jgi:hypothetical protein
MAELGPLLPQDMLLEGSNWKESSVDIAIAGELAHICTTCVHQPAAQITCGSHNGFGSVCILRKQLGLLVVSFSSASIACLPVA